MRVPTPPNEAQRLIALRASGLLEAPPSLERDAFCRLAARCCDCPIAAISLVDSERVLVLASHGLARLETPRERSVCTHTILDTQPLVVPDLTADPRFASIIDGCVTPWFRFYAGLPLHGDAGHALGVLCVLDSRPRDLTPGQLDQLRTLAALVADHLLLNSRTGQLAQTQQQLSLQKALVQSSLASLEDTRREAEKSNAAKSEFLATMSHEIRTPMTAILGFADLLALQDESTACPLQRSEYLQTIRRNGEHLLTIINDILDLTRIDAGRLTIESTPTRPSQIISEVLDLLEIKAREKALALEIQYVTPIPETITSDPLRLRQILLNLVGNAIKFTQAGRITVLASFDPGARLLSLDVTDTGIGIAPECLPRLFEAFVQAEPGTSRKFGGSGLGLRISRQLARLLGGNISVESRLGTGSTFHLTLPTGSLADMGPSPQLTPPPAEDANPRVRLSTGPRPLTGTRVLVAEDGPDNQRLIRSFLELAGASVTLVPNGKLAVSALTSDAGELLDPAPFDLLVTDIQMPELDGHEATRFLRSAGSTLPIVALTAHAMPSERAACLQAGCDDYASKPIDRLTLIDSCKRALRARSLARPAAA